MGTPTSQIGQLPFARAGLTNLTYYGPQIQQGVTVVLEAGAGVPLVVGGGAVAYNAAVRARLYERLVDAYAARVLLGDSKRTIGPAASIAIDKVTGRISLVYFNDPQGRLPSNLSNSIATRLSTIPSFVNSKNAGSHAEVYAVDELLRARPGAQLGEIQVLTIETEMNKYLLQVKDPCPQCAYILLDVEYLP